MSKRPIAPNLMLERQFHAQGCTLIAGIDEVGRGTWAGPVAAAVVCLPVDNPRLVKALRGLRDSKEMTSRQREQMVMTIQAWALGWGIGSASSTEIDLEGIVAATKMAMGRALDAMRAEFPQVDPHCLLLDAMVWPEMKDRYTQVSIVDGDARSLSIAAASVLAKVWRDDLMRQIDEEYPQYSFSEHKGYGTTLHWSALRAFGPCPHHRLSFKPLRALTVGEQS
jgi:ribonuclease HII